MSLVITTSFPVIWVSWRGIVPAWVSRADMDKQMLSLALLAALVGIQVSSADAYLLLDCCRH